MTGLQVLHDDQMSRVAKFLLRTQLVKMKTGFFIDNHTAGLSQDRHLNNLIATTIALSGMCPFGFNQSGYLIIAAGTCTDRDHRVVM